MIKALTEHVIEADIQPVVQPLNICQAVRQEFIPQALVFSVAFMQLHRLCENFATDICMRFGRSDKRGIRLCLIQGATKYCDQRLLVSQFFLQSCNILLLLFLPGLVIVLFIGDSLKGSLLFLLQFTCLGQLFLRLVIVHHPSYILVQPSQFQHRISGIGLRIDKVFIAVNNHTELRTPVTQMVIGDHPMPEKPMDFRQCIANHG